MRRVAAGGVAIVGWVLVATGAGSAPLPNADVALAPAVENAPVRILRGLGALDTGYPILRWPRRLAPAAALEPRDDRSGVWLRIGQYGGTEATAPGGGRRLHAGSARIAAPFPFFPLAGGDDVFGQLWLRVGARAGVRAEYHVVELGDPRSPWHGAAPATGGAARLAIGEGGAAHNAVAHVVGVGLALALSERLGLDAQYGHAFGGTLTTLDDAGAASHFGYLELTLRF